MGKIFVGMIFVFVDFNITFGVGTTGVLLRIGLIPDFVGYIIMLSGLKELKGLSERFAQVRPLVIGMIVFSVIEYMMNLLGIGHTVTFVHTLTVIDLIVLAVTIGLTVVSFIISYNIIMGIKDIEVSKTVFLNSDTLYLVWKLKVIFVIVAYVLMVIPLLALISIIIVLGITICFLCFFYKTKRLFDQQRAQIYRESDHFDGGFRQFDESERQFEGERNQFEEQNRQFEGERNQFEEQSRQGYERNRQFGEPFNEQTVKRNSENDDVFGRRSEDDDVFGR